MTAEGPRCSAVALHGKICFSNLLCTTVSRAEASSKLNDDNEQTSNRNHIIKSATLAVSVFQMQNAHLSGLNEESGTSTLGPCRASRSSDSAWDSTSSSSSSIFRHSRTSSASSGPNALSPSSASCSYHSK